MMFDGLSFLPSVRRRIRKLQTDAHHPEAHLLLAILDRAVHDLDRGGAGYRISREVVPLEAGSSRGIRFCRRL